MVWIADMLLGWRWMADKLVVPQRAKEQPATKFNDNNQQKRPEIVTVAIIQKRSKAGQHRMSFLW